MVGACCRETGAGACWKGSWVTTATSYQTRASQPFERWQNVTPAYLVGPMSVSWQTSGQGCKLVLRWNPCAQGQYWIGGSGPDIVEIVVIEAAKIVWAISSSAGRTSGGDGGGGTVVGRSQARGESCRIPGGKMSGCFQGKNSESVDIL